MALGDIALCARALIKIGARPITTFNDGTVESEVASALYAVARDALLSSYNWSFATGQVELTAAAIPPVADYTNAFLLPPDRLRIISAGGHGSGRGLKYRITRDVLHTNADAVTLTYIFRCDEAEFPAFFEQALIMRLAAEFCLPLTENNARAEVLYKMAENEMARARQIDAQQDTPSRLENFSLIDVRG